MTAAHDGLLVGFESFAPPGLGIQTGTCSGWSGFTYHSLALSLVAQQPKSMSLTVVDSLSDDFATSSISCTDEYTVRSVLTRLAGFTGGLFSSACGGSQWSVNVCSSGLPALCVECDDPCASPSTTPACGNYVVPCDRWLGCSGVPSIQYFGVEFNPVQMPPEVVSMLSEGHRTSLTVTAVLSHDGVLYCGAYVAGRTPSSTVAVQQLGFSGETMNNVTTILLSGLIASTEYRVYCVSSTINGNMMSYHTMVRGVSTAKTLCCKTLSVAVNYVSLTADRSQLNVLTMSIDSVPISDISLTISAVNVGENSTALLTSGVQTSKVYPFLPQNVNFVAASSLASAVSISLSGLPAGYYQVSVDVSGTDKADYSTAFPKGRLIAVLSTSQPLPAPDMISATFSADGSLLYISFSSASNKGLLTSQFRCRLLFLFVGSEFAKCQWSDASTVVASVSGNTFLVPGNVVHLLGNSSVRALCTAPGGDCSRWPRASMNSVVSTAPVTATIPTVAISAPASVSRCDSVVIDLSSSRGGGGRDWFSRSVIVSASNGNSTILQEFVTNVYLPSSIPLPIPLGLLQAGTSYTFVVSLCSFLRMCGQDRKTVYVLSGSAPSVTLIGSAVRSLYRNSSVGVASNAFVSACSGGVTTQGLSYQWSLSPSAVASSVSNDPSVFLLKPFTLASNTMYSASLTVTVASTGVYSTASTTILVLAGAIVPVIPGGASRSIRQLSSAALDASKSFDTDVSGSMGPAAGLVYSWSCFQSGPVISSYCGVQIYNASSSTLSVFAQDGSVNSSSSVSLLLRDSVGLRSAVANVIIRVVSSVSPLVTISNSSTGKINPGSRLLLVGSVDLSAASSGTSVWTVDNGAVNLDALSMVPVSQSITTTVTPALLLLAPNSLPAGTEFTFSLTAVLASGELSTATITIVTNAPPTPGSVLVSPRSGIAMTVTFTFNAALWVDEDAPISYQFGFLSASTGVTLTVQSRSEMSYGTSLLPSGSGLNSLLVCAGEVFDVYSANYTAYDTVQVNSSSLSLGAALNSLTSQLSGVLASVNGMKKLISLSASVLNSVNCSSIRNCTLLNRYSCASVSNSCGPCLDGFIGSSGDGNSVCLIASDAVALLSHSGTIVKCEGFADCPRGYECRMENFQCFVPSKTCPSDCGVHGTCIFVQSSTGNVVESCSVYDADCSAQCTCDDEWYGDDCSMGAGELATRQAAKADITGRVAQLVGIENPSESVVSGWLAGLMGVSDTAADMTNGSLTSVLLVADYIIGAAAGVGMSVDSIASVLDVLDCGASAVSWSSSAGRRIRSRRLLSNISSGASADVYAESVVASTTDLLSRYAVYVTSSMVSGQVPLTFIKSTFRLTTLLASSTSAVSLPLTTLEQLGGFSMSSIQLPSQLPVDGSVAFSASAISAALYGDASFQSNPIQVRVSQSDMSTACDSNACEMIIVLQNSNPVLFSNPVVTEFTTHCLFDDYGVHTYLCPTGEVAVAQCNGSSGMIRTQCPFLEHLVSCSSVVGLTSTSSGCRTVAFTATNVTCACPITGFRRRLTSTEDDSDEEPPTTSVNLVSMSQYLASNMLQTWSSAGDLDAASLTRGWNVILTVGIFAVVIAVSIYGAHRADQKSKIVQPANTDLTKAAWTLKSRRTIMPKKDQQLAKKLRKRVALEDERMSIENSLPSILRSSSFKEKFLSEVKRFHRWFGVVFHFSKDFPRVLRIVSLVCSVFTMLFIQAVTYKLTNPDDGSCEMLLTAESCEAPRAVYAKGDPKCYWTPGYRQGTCRFIQPSDSLKVVLFVAVFAAILSTPISVASDWIIMNVLAARTTDYRTARADMDSFTGIRHKAVLPAVSYDTSASDNSPALVTTLQDDMEGLIMGLKHYRQTLTMTQRQEFDGLWGLSKTGEFISATGSKGSFSRSSGPSSIENTIKTELHGVRSQLANEFDMFSLGYRDGHEKGQRLLFLFQKDLMPGVNGQILESKQKRDSHKPVARSPASKLAGWLFIVLINLGMLFYIMLFALQETRQRQSAWFQSFMIWLVLDVILVSTAVVYVTHVFIPMIIMRDVAKIKNKLLSTVRDHYAALKRARNGGLEDSISEQFNAAEHLFVSYRLAKLFPALGESGIILRYSTAWPKQSYHHHVDVTKTYSAKYTALTKAASMLLIFVLTNLLSIPPTLQDMVIHIASTATIGYTMLLHVQLFAIYPALVILPTMLAAILAHFLVKGGRARAKAELAKLMPVEEKLRRPKVLHNAPRPAVDVKNGATSHVLPRINTCAGQQSTFKTRRQSLLAGRAAVREMMNMAVSEEAKNHDFDCDGSRRGSDSSDDDDVPNGDLQIRPADEIGTNERNIWYTPSTAAKFQVSLDDLDDGSDVSDSYGDEDDSDESDCDGHGLREESYFGSIAVHQTADDVTFSEAEDAAVVSWRPEVSNRYISSVLSRMAQTRHKKQSPVAVARTSAVESLPAVSADVRPGEDERKDLAGEK
jgi:hypothetical protein